MADLDCAIVAAYLVRAADPAHSAQSRGRAYEDAVAHLLGAVAAYYAAASALQDGIRILVLTTEDLISISSAEDLVDLLHRRLLDLIATGTFTVM